MLSLADIGLDGTCSTASGANVILLNPAMELRCQDRLNNLGN
jgi:hypothetical protein